MKFDQLTQNYLDRHPAECAYHQLTTWQKRWYCFLGLAVVICIAVRWDVGLYLLNFFFAALYFGVILFRLAAISLSLLGRGVAKVNPVELHSLETDALPIYTILVPLYKEAQIAEKIVSALDALDYPDDKLDIKLLLEADDEETQAAMRELELPDQYDVIVVPDGEPKTKPRACNFGLEAARGEFCVIYDAEDRPEPDQLKKVVTVFREQSEHTSCVQAKLNFYNSRQNLLTRWFSIEYSTWFDLFLPGLQRLGVPVPLGGTSNHFRTRVLRELGGWDPFNVTEDCDLGVRIYEAGYQTTMIDSTTWEEANCQLWNWLRQRSRWVKGFFQTHLAHTRKPRQTIKRLGLRGYAGFLLSVGGSSLIMITNLVYWAVTGLYLVLLGLGSAGKYSAWDFICHGADPANLPAVMVVRGYEIRAWPLIYIGPQQDRLLSTLSVIFFIIVCVLITANLLFVLMHAMACVRRRDFRLLPFALLMPIYWVLISLGAVKGLWQLFTKPFYWEKTVHGLD